MSSVLTNMTVSDWAAWWGAGVATLVAAWEVYKWFTSGAKLLIKVEQEKQNNPFSTRVFVTNDGDRPTTLTKIHGAWFRGKIEILQSDGYFPWKCGALPKTLQAGDYWECYFNFPQTKETPDDDCRVRVELHVAARLKPYITEVTWKKFNVRKRDDPGERANFHAEVI